MSINGSSVDSIEEWKSGNITFGWRLGGRERIRNILSSKHSMPGHTHIQSIKTMRITWNWTRITTSTTPSTLRQCSRSSSYFHFYWAPYFRFSFWRSLSFLLPFLKDWLSSDRIERKNGKNQICKYSCFTSVFACCHNSHAKFNRGTKDNSIPAPKKVPCAWFELTSKP